MNMRSLTRGVLRAQEGLAGLRQVYIAARYIGASVSDAADKYKGKRSTRINSPATSVEMRRQFVATHVTAETRDGKQHRLMEEGRRRQHAKPPLHGAGRVRG